MARIFVFTIVLLLAGACSRPLYNMPYRPPEGANDVYKLGWEHGCKSGFSMWGNDWIKTFYSFVQDPKMRKDKMYGQAWNDAFMYCRTYVAVYQIGSSYKKPTDGVFTGLSLRPGGDMRESETIMNEGFNPWYKGLNTMGWGDWQIKSAPRSFSPLGQSGDWNGSDDFWDTGNSAAYYGNSSSGDD